jgi:hypothetical protein
LNDFINSAGYQLPLSASIFSFTAARPLGLAKAEGVENV